MPNVCAANEESGAGMRQLLKRSRKTFTDGAGARERALAMGLEPFGFHAI
jgi:hypothetical protein